MADECASSVSLTYSASGTAPLTNFGRPQVYTLSSTARPIGTRQAEAPTRKAWVGAAVFLGCAFPLLVAPLCPTGQRRQPPATAPCRNFRPCGCARCARPTTSLKVKGVACPDLASGINYVAQNGKKLAGTQQTRTHLWRFVMEDAASEIGRPCRLFFQPPRPRPGGAAASNKDCLSDSQSRPGQTSGAPARPQTAGSTAGAAFARDAYSRGRGAAGSDLRGTGSREPVCPCRRQRGWAAMHFHAPHAGVLRLRTRLAAGPQSNGQG